MLKEKTVTTVLNKLKKRDSWFLANYTINPYEGCSCNCQYCYIRGSRYGENLAEGLSIKSNALPLLDKQLKNRAAKNEYGFVVVGSVTDAYLHHEKQYAQTRAMLELLLKHRFPVFITTKCHLILRDIDLLKAINEQAILPPDLQPVLKHGVILGVSVSTLDAAISERLEPGALLPAERLAVLHQLKQAGFLAGLNAIPVLPYISDTDEALEQLIVAAKKQAADFFLCGSLTLFGNNAADSKTLYYKFLQQHYPQLVKQYHHLYGTAYYPPMWYQQQLKQRVNKWCGQYQLSSSIIKHNTSE